MLIFSFATLYKTKRGKTMARPTKFNEQLCEQLCTLHEEGLPQKSCADYCGIDRTTLHRWLKKGEKAKSGKYRQFFLNWIRSEAKYEMKHLTHISDSSSWLAHQYLLQVKDPETYVVAEKQEMEMKADTNITADVDMTNPVITENDLEMLKDLIEDKHDDNPDSGTD